MEETPTLDLPATLLSEVKKALASAAAAVAPHEEEMRFAWRRRLEGLGIDADQLNALSGLTLGLDQVDLKSGSFDSLMGTLEREGQALASRGVPLELTLAALFVRLEVSLPYLLPRVRRKGSADMAIALLRLTFLSATTIQSHYENVRRKSWRSFDERERVRLSRDLHDEIGHQLVVLKLYLELISKEIPKGRSGEVRQKLTEALALVGQSIQSVRRLILDLGPAVLEEVGFVAAVRLYAKQFTARTAVNVHVRDTGLRVDVPGGYATPLYRVIQGALANVIKHAEARNVTINIGSVRDSVIVMTIEDDGMGFDPSRPRQAFGLAAMRDRIEGLGGRFHLESAQNGSGRRKSGTRIEIDLPLTDHVKTTSMTREDARNGAFRSPNGDPSSRGGASPGRARTRS